MKNNRTQIDQFLLALNLFIEKYHTTMDDVEKVFIPIFKANKDNKTFVAPDKRWLDIPTLTMMCNPYKIWFIKEWERKKIENKFKMNRTSAFVQSVAYKLPYKVIKDVSYEHIFMKHLIQNSEDILTKMDRYHIYEGKLYQYDLKEFLVPEEYDTNDNLILY